MGLPPAPKSWLDMPSFKEKATLQAEDQNTWPGVMPIASKTWLLPNVKVTSGKANTGSEGKTNHCDFCGLCHGSPHRSLAGEFRVYSHPSLHPSIPPSLLPSLSPSLHPSLHRWQILTLTQCTLGAWGKGCLKLRSEIC